MLAHSRINSVKTLGLFLLLVVSLYGKNDFEWELDERGSALSCNLNIPDLSSVLFPDTSAGICSTYNRGVFEGLEGALSVGGILAEILGSSFNVGKVAKCDLKGADVSNSLISQFCKATAEARQNFPLSPSILLATNTPFVEGLKPRAPVLIKDVKFPSGLTGDDIYFSYGGQAIVEATDDEHGSVADTYKNFNKVNLLLIDESLRMHGHTNISELKLPETKGDSMHDEDEVTQVMNTAYPKIIDFIDNVTLALGSLYVDEIPVVTETSLAEYASLESAKTKEYLLDENLSGYTDIYERGIALIMEEYVHKQKFQTQEDNYIYDPSETSLAYVDNAHKNEYKWASLVQISKNTLLKMETAIQMQKLGEKLDIARKIASIAASTFRDDIAKNELDLLLEAADASVSLP